jgi:IS5 family transposase
VSLPDGKTRKPYEFGVKASIAVTHRKGLVVGARTFPGNPYDGHTLAAQIEQTSTLLENIGVKPTTAVVDMGYRGVDEDVPAVQVIHRGKAKRLTAQQKTWLRRRQAVEPTIGHLKADHRMDRCWLKGTEGDALHAVLCAAGFNIRWLMRAIADPPRQNSCRLHRTKELGVRMRRRDGSIWTGFQEAGGGQATATQHLLHRGGISRGRCVC